MNNNKKSFLLIILPITFASPLLVAEPTIKQPKTEETITQLPDMDVVGEANLKKQLPGSSVVIDQETMYKSHVFTLNEALRKTPGVYVRDEEGFGIRPNIALRGMNPFRSTKISFLEDGLPLNYAPYGDNDIYYHPPVERYDNIEVMKGADMNKYGPQTINGVLNYITPNPAEKPGGFLSFSGGNRDYLSGHLRYGGMARDVKVVEGVGGIADYIHKEGSGSRDNTFARIDDVNLKGIIDIDAKNRLIVRGDFYEEKSQSTFGLTEAEYKNFGPEYNPFKNDEFTTNRNATSATHEYHFNDDVTLSTSFYWSEFNRDFWRQMNQQPTDTQCGSAFRESRLSGQAVDVDKCNFSRGRLRSYETWGVTPTLHANYSFFGVDSVLDAGFRAHIENQYRKTENGKSSTARTGNLVENNERYAEAFSGFVQNRFNVGNWAITPGVRVESVSYERINLPYEGDPTFKTAGNNKRTSGKSELTEILPSFVVEYSPIEEATLFFDWHRGFAPPRVEDSVYTTGDSVEIGAESSWNYEIGIKTKPIKGVTADLTYFHNDFENLIALGTIGGNDTPVAQGKALFEGLEFSNRVDAGDVFNWTHNPYLQIAYTWVPTAESSSAFRCLPLSNGAISASCPGGYVFGSKAGKRNPYAPEHLVTATVGYSHPVGFDFHLETVFVGEQFGDFMNLESGSDHPNGANSVEARSGQYGKIKDFAIVNLSSTYTVYKGLDVFFSVKNIFDNHYIVDRVRGILPSSPRLIQAGFKYEF